MAYTLHFKVIDKVLRVEIHGDRTEGDLSSNAKAAWTQMAEVCSKSSLSIILVVSHATGEYGAFNAYDVVTAMAECGIQRTWKIAFVNLEKASYEDLKLAETIAVNRGFQFTVFHTEEEAVAWLSSISAQ